MLPRCFHAATVGYCAPMSFDSSVRLGQMLKMCSMATQYNLHSQRQYQMHRPQCYLHGMELSDRLRRARIEAGFQDGTEAARRFGWPAPTYLSHENGSRGVKGDRIRDYARAFRVSPEWLMFGGAEPPDSASPPATLEGQDDLVPIYNVYASAGMGALVADPEEIIDQLSFPPGYLRRITSGNPRDLAIIATKGDSMTPTLSDNDVVMIDTTKRDLSFDGLFVLRDGGASLLVKRIGRGSRRGTVMLISDNKSYPPSERDVSEIEVIGKVVWRGVKE